MKRREYHGMKDLREYGIWGSMLTRCYNRRARSFRFYGARGVTVCERWRQSFAAFLADVGEAPGAEYTLDRIDSLLGYQPGNVRWALRSVQARNRRSTHLISFQGRTQCLSDWADELGISRPTLSDRFQRGWTVERAFNEPIGTHPEHRRITFRGESLPLSEWARRTGLNVNTVDYRLRNGWSVEDALTLPPDRTRR